MIWIRLLRARCHWLKGNLLNGVLLSAISMISYTARAEQGIREKCA